MSQPPSPTPIVLTFLGPRLALQRLSPALLTPWGLQLTNSRTLSDQAIQALEWTVRSADASLPSLRDLRTQLLEQLSSLGPIDLAVQSDSSSRRLKRVAAFDMDSTLIRCEVVDEFARELGRYDEVAAITEEAMRGNLDFDQSLKLRVAKLRGLTQEQIDRVYDRIELMPGAEALITVLKSLGSEIALLSGGFLPIAKRLQARLGIDHIRANALEMLDGACTGKVLPPIVNAQGKADHLETLAHAAGAAPDEVLAVGDGANDLLMLARAGLGVAFNAKPTVRERASVALNQPGLLPILYFLGLDDSEIAARIKASSDRNRSP